jgi:ribonuclease HI
MRDIIAFTDAGHHEKENYFFSSIFLLDGEEEYKKMFKIRKDNFENSICMMEMQPIKYLIEFFKNKKDINLIIYTDNLVNFNFLNLNHKPRGKKSKNLKKYLFSLKNRINEFNKKNNIEVRWIKSHCHVYGNHISDRLCNLMRNKHLGNKYNKMGYSNFYDPSGGTTKVYLSKIKDITKWKI